MTAIDILYLGSDADSVGELLEPGGTEPVVHAVASTERAIERFREFDYDGVVVRRSPADAETVAFLRAVREVEPTAQLFLNPDDFTAVVRTVRNRGNHDREGSDGAASAQLETGSVTDEGVLQSQVRQSGPSDLTEGDTDADGDEQSDTHDSSVVTDRFVNRVLDRIQDIYFVYSFDRNFVDWNQRLNEVTGRSDEEISVSQPFELIAEHHHERLREKMAKVVANGEATAEFDIVSNDGEAIPHEFTGTLVMDNDDSRTYICGIARDLRPVRQREAELRAQAEKLNDALEEVRRSNDELEQFAYAVSHDLKEPLRMVSSYLRLLERRYGGELDDDAEEFIEFAVDGAQQMRERIDALLTYSRIGRDDGSFEPTDLDEVVGRARSNLEVAIEESNADVSVEPLPEVMGDDEQLVRVFQNLIGNAIKHADDEPTVHVAAERDGDECVTTVADDGPGIPPETIDRVFDLFYSGTDESSGVGLALCEKIVSYHDGRIDVDSEPGEGTTFSVVLPAADPA